MDELPNSLQISVISLLYQIFSNMYMYL